MTNAYTPLRPARSEFVRVRGLRYHVHAWGNAPAGERPAPLVMLHGYMDVGASFQFVVDALARERVVFAPDWRGFGLSDAPGTDSYWFPGYLADLDALLDALAPGAPVDLVGHSMGGNVAMLYAGVRPQRIRRLANLEGFGMPPTRPGQAPERYAKWLDQLRQPARLRSYASLDEVARRLTDNNPRLAPDKAAWLAGRWSRREADGRWHLLADPVHRRVNPVLYREEEALACWQRIAAPMLWVEGDRTEVERWWGGRFTRADFEARLACVPHVERAMLSPSGHMVHHDQPQALAARLEAFLDRH